MKKDLIKASYSNIIVSESVKIDKKIGGSASFILDENDLPVRYVDSKNKTSISKAKVKCVVIIDFDIYGSGEILHLDHDLFLEYEISGFVKKLEPEYRLNKQKVRSKILAYANTNKSKIFMAFYSISFPKGLTDSTIRKIHNTVLTRLRKLNKSFTYIWIAERQKNGTLHFHMLTNTHFNIRVINHMYAKAIDNQIKCDQYDHVNYDYKKYNGCDVKLVLSIEKLCKYLTKYVTKNNESMNGLLWNCDKSVSALVTHLYLNYDELKSIYNKIAYVKTFIKDGFIEGVKMEFDLYDYGSYKPKLIFENLHLINEYILKQCATPKFKPLKFNIPDLSL